MFLKAAMLNVSGGDDALADGGGIFAGLLAGHFFERNERDFDVHVNAIQQRPRNSVQVTLDFPRGALGFAGHFAVGRWVHGGHKHEVGREGGGADGARDGDAAFFQRLPHGFENAAFEFWQFVEEEHSVVGDGDFAGDGVGAAAEESGITGGVVRGAEWALGNQRLVVGEESRNAVDFGGFQSFVSGKGRQDGGESLGQHRFSSAGRPNQEDVVASGGGYFEGAFDGFLAADFGKVGFLCWRSLGELG